MVCCVAVWCVELLEDVWRMDVVWCLELLENVCGG